MKHALCDILSNVVFLDNQQKMEKRYVIDQRLLQITKDAPLQIFQLLLECGYTLANLVPSNKIISEISLIGLHHIFANFNL